MRKKYVLRLFIVLCLCCISIFMKSGPTGCKFESASYPDTHYITSSNIQPDAGENEIITYYGFYSKF